MPALSIVDIQTLLCPYMAGVEAELERPDLVEKLSVYLDLLLRWNERINLTAIRDPRLVVQRHFGESLFVARHLDGAGSLLDLGSGAGFPGIPIQLWHPGLQVTLAEVQGKKAAFLREVVRSLSLSTKVWPSRAEKLITLQNFDSVVMRAVDNPATALELGARLSRNFVWVLGSSTLIESSVVESVFARYKMPLSENSWLIQLHREAFHVEHRDPE